MSVALWISGSGLTYWYPLKIVPFNEVAKYCSASLWMVDSGITLDRPSPIRQIVDAQSKYASVAVGPDVLMDADATRSRFLEWLPLIRAARPQAKVCYCTQGTVAQRVEAIRELHASVDWFGAGLACKAPGVKFTDDEREEVLRACVPVAHGLGKPFHAFGIGLTGRQANMLLSLGVDSCDSSTPLRIASMGKILDANLRQVHVCDASPTQSVKEALVRMSIMNGLHALENGVHAADLFCSEEAA